MSKRSNKRKRAREREFEFLCSACGEVHRGPPSVNYDVPPSFDDVPEDARERRIALSDDLCHILPPGNEPDGRSAYFIRGVLDVPIVGADEPFRWGVWVSQAEETFERYVDTFGEDPTGLKSFGWLLANLPGYRELDEDGAYAWLPCDVDWGPAGQRPRIDVQECDNPIYREQRDGMSWERAAELVETMMHPD